MLRRQEDCIIVTFPTTAAALAAEATIQAAGLPGRLIPVPREITAGCGLAWRAPATNAQAIAKLLGQKAAVYESMRRFML